MNTRVKSFCVDSASSPTMSREIGQWEKRRGDKRGPWHEYRHQTRHGEEKTGGGEATVSTFLLDYMWLNVSLKLYLFFSILMTNLSGVVYPKSYFYISLCLLPIRTGRVSCSGLGRACCCWCWGVITLRINQLTTKGRLRIQQLLNPSLITSDSGHGDRWI